MRERTAFQTFAFNAPYQIAVPLSVMSRKGSSFEARDADTYSFDVAAGDWVVIASDGVWDNVEEAECARMCRVAESAAQAAAGICDAATKAGRSDKDGPFAKYARAHKKLFRGGKEDDVSVVVLRIVDAEQFKAKL